MGGGVCESVSESLMWAYEALMLGFLNSFFFFFGGWGGGGVEDACRLFNLWSIELRIIFGVEVFF